MPRIRTAAPGDLAGLPAIEAAADRMLEASLGLPLPNAEPAGVAETLFILVAGTPAVGFARVDEVDGQAHLEQLSVHPDSAGQGIGRALVAAALQLARGRGYESMTLCTFSGVPFNGPFYASCGFSPVPHPAGELAALRSHEARLGLDALGPRVAMRIRL